MFSSDGLEETVAAAYSMKYMYLYIYMCVYIQLLSVLLFQTKFEK